MKKEFDLSKLKKRPGPVKTYPEAAKVAINIRLDPIVLNDVKNEAQRLGLPYQSLIHNVLHRFTNGKLLDKISRRKGT